MTKEKRKRVDHLFGLQVRVADMLADAAALMISLMHEVIQFLSSEERKAIDDYSFSRRKTLDGFGQT